MSGASAFNSSTSKIASANCPSGKVATGLGWGMGGGGEAHINFAGIGVGDSSSPGGVTLVANEDDNGFSGNWQMNPVVICASA